MQTYMETCENVVYAYVLDAKCQRFVLIHTLLKCLGLNSELADVVGADSSCDTVAAAQCLATYSVPVMFSASLNRDDKTAFCS